MRPDRTQGPRRFLALWPRLFSRLALIYERLTGVGEFHRPPRQQSWHSRPLSAQLTDMASPVVEDRQDLTALVRHQRQVDGIDADVTEPLQFVEIVRRAAEPQRQRFRVASRLLRHLAEGRHVFLR